MLDTDSRRLLRSVTFLEMLSNLNTEVGRAVRLNRRVVDRIVLPDRRTSTNLTQRVNSDHLSSTQLREPGAFYPLPAVFSSIGRVLWG